VTAVLVFARSGPLEAFDCVDADCRLFVTAALSGSRRAEFSDRTGPASARRPADDLLRSEWIPDIEHRSHLDDAHRLGRALRNLHDELRTFNGDLGGLRALREDIERLHGRLQPTDAVEAGQVSSLRARLDALDEVVFKSALPTQALHGDASLSNLLHTPQRLVWNDFEDTFRGPVHWDVAGYVISLRARGVSSSFVRRMLDAYGWGDEQELAPFIAAHAVYDEIWQMYGSQRRSSRELNSQATPSSGLRSR
jgi:aminoglycoside phosphotransferase (APT) family kinase protein